MPPPPSTPKGSRGTGIFPSPPRSEQLLYEPITEKKVHQEPISDVLVTDTVIYTADHTGVIKAWVRPGVRAAEGAGKVAPASPGATGSGRR